MSYQVLALKFRPQTFQDVVGQEHVTTTLANAIGADRVAHAILFAGPRGTGKTTIARILAKAMNCQEGPTAVPCNQCKSCRSITSGNSADVLEIDGASNNSVDQVRDLRENVAYLPASSRLKIYIIDEVHMLSTAAFNALLKTLEEPPEHVMFIFATTEIHKIPVTILSRCQRHDLGRIPLSMISGHLEKLCSSEGYQLSQESYDIIATEADGSMRDALSLLDRIMSCSRDKTISHDAVLQNLGIIDRTILFDISDAVIKGDGQAVIKLIDRVHSLGFDLKKFYGAIVRHFRNLTVRKMSGDADVLQDISDHERNIMGNVVKDLSRNYLSQTLTLLISEEPLVKNFSHTRTAIEMVLLKLAQIRPSLDIDDLIGKLDVLAEAIASGTFSGPSGHGEPSLGHHHSGTLPSDTPPTSKAVSPTDHYRAEPQVSVKPPRHEATHPSTEPLPPSPPGAAASHETAPQQTSNSGGHPSPPLSWDGCVKTLAQTLPFIGAILTRGEVKAITETDIQIYLSGSAFDFSRLDAKFKEVEKLISTYFNRPMTLTLQKQETRQADTGEKSRSQLKQEIMSHPFVSEAITLFNATVVDIQPT